MQFYRYFFLSLVVAAIVLVMAPGADAQTTDNGASISRSSTPVRTQSLETEGGVRFTENRGQIIDTRGELRPDILYTIQSKEASLYFRAQGISYVFSKIEATTEPGEQPDHDRGDDETPFRVTGTYRMDMELIGANPNVTLDADRQTGDYSNYYLAHCPDGILRVRSFGRITYREVYPHIDMVIYSAGGGVKCDFVVRPGGRVSDIRMRYVASDDIDIDREGALKVTTPLGYVEEERPYSYQGSGAAKAAVESRYRLEDGVLGFEVGNYDRSQTLVIDPYRKWATYYGGSGTENLNGGDPSEVDRTGNPLITGYTTNNAFPTSTGAHQTAFGGGTQDAFVVKFNSGGNRLWATYYGGSNDELAHGIITDDNRNVFIAGHTFSTNFPTTSGAFQTTYGNNRDGFVVKFDSNGTRLWATYVGGSNFDDGYGFAADSSGNVAVVITTGSSGLGTSGTFQPTKPTAAGNNTSDYDVLIVKLTASGTRAWATYYGGNNNEYGYAAASDNHDNIIFTGWTYSTNFPTTTGAQQTSKSGTSTTSDAFVVKLDNAGSRLWGTYYGGTGTEDDDPVAIGYAGMATDGVGNIFITGSTTGNFPTTTGAYQTTYGGGTDGFAVKFDTSGVRQWATYIGGSAKDIGAGIASNAVGGVLVTGFTSSTNTSFAMSTNTYQANNAGGEDVFVIKLSGAGARVWSTYYGGTGNDDGEGISFDPFGSIIVAGHTASNNFPTLLPYQGTYAGSTDAFAMLFCDIDPGVVDTTGRTTFCQGDSVILSVQHGYSSILWSTGATSDSITIKTTGNYWVRLTNGAGCVAYSDTVHVLVYPKPTATISGNLTLCDGDSTLLDAGSGFASYRWTTGATTQRITVRQAGDYGVKVTNAGGCSDSTQVTVRVNPKPDSVTIVPPGPHRFCDGGSVTLTATGGTGSYQWSNGERTQSIVATKSGTYTVTVTNQYGCSITSKPVIVALWPRPILQIIPYGPTVLCEGDSLRLGATPGYPHYLWSTGDTTDKIMVKQASTYNVTVTDTNGCTASASIIITVVQKPKPVISARGPLEFCQGDSVVLDAGSYASYQWSSGERTQRIVVKESGTFSVAVIDPYSCPGFSDTVTVVVKPRPVATLNGPVVVCANSTVDYSVTQDTGVSYDWSVSGTASGVIVSGAGTSTIRVKWGPSGNGIVRVVVVSKSNGCATSSELQVRVGTDLIPVITANRSLKLCEGDSVTLDAGSGYSSYQWSNGATSQKITVKDTGTFTVTVRDANGCGGTSLPVVVKRNPPPTPVITAPKTAICPGESLTLDAGDYGKFQWEGGQRTRTIVVSAAGSHVVTVTDSNGCTATSAPFTVTMLTPPSPTIDGPNSVCLNSTATYSVKPAGAGDTFLWSATGGGTIAGGQGTSTVTVQWSTSGTGTVSVTQTSAATGCTGASQPYLVAVGSTLTPKITAPAGTVLCQGDTVTLSAPDGYATYLWSTGAQTRDIRVGEAGTYRVTVSDAGGCSGSDEITVSVKQLPYPFILPKGPIALCEGDSVTLTAASGYLSYEWSSGETTQQIVVRRAGSYSVTAVNENGCRGSSEAVEVTINPIPAQPVVTVTGGDTLTSTPATTYQWYYEGNSIAGATGQMLIANDVGLYSVAITNQFGCSAISEPVEAVGAASEIDLGEYEAVPGEHLKIPITLSSSRNLDNVGIHSYRAEVRFLKNLLYPTGSTPMGIEDGDHRVVTIEGSRDAGVTSGAIGQLEVVAALGDTLTTPLHVDLFEWTDGKARITTHDGLVRIKPQGGWKLYLPDGRLSLLPVIPNPSTGPVTIIFETIESGRTQLYIVDVIGRRVITLVDMEMDRGRHELDPKFDVSVLAAGNYFLVLETPTGRIVQPLQVQH
jgi:hypothetical protein